MLISDEQKELIKTLSFDDMCEYAQDMTDELWEYYEYVQTKSTNPN